MYQKKYFKNKRLIIYQYYENYNEITKNIDIPVPTKNQEIVIMRGYPGSGKSKVALDIYGKSYNYIKRCI